MDDVSVSLIEAIRESFLSGVKGNSRIAELLAGVQAGTAGYAAAGDYAYEIGQELSKAFLTHLTSDALPDGRLYQNIAEKVVSPMLKADYELVSKAAMQVQEFMNAAAGIGLKAVKAPLDAKRVDGIVHKLSNAPSIDDAAWVLDEPVKTFSQSVVDDTLRRNAEFQSKAGLRPRIIRRAESNCCEWCSRMEGIYDYPNDVPDDVYRRHERCRCVVEYDPGVGKRQNTWSKRWTDNEERAKIEARKRIGAESIQARSFESRELLEQHFTKHTAEYGTISVQEYLRRASCLADAELSEDVVQLLRSDMSTSRYCYSTNDFLVLNENGTVRTFFKPELGKEYWKYELERNK